MTSGVAGASAVAPVPAVGPRRGSPTADLYFADACADWIAAGSVRRLAPTVFLAGDTLVVMRHARGAGRLPKAQRLIYLSDDAAAKGMRDRSLPLAYRAKLALVEARAEARFAPRADAIIAASDAIAGRMRARAPSAEVIRLDPAWPRPRSVAGEGPVRRLACLQAMTHRADWAPLVPVLGGLLRDHPRLHLTLSGNLAVPRAWRGHKQVTVLPVMDWVAYRAWMADQRFDIGLYPLNDTPFNRARSTNKLGEYAQFGAAAVIPHHWAAGRGLQERACVIEGGPEAWRREIAGLIADPGRARRLADGNRAALIADDPAARQRAVWGRLLGL